MSRVSYWLGALAPWLVLAAAAATPAAESPVDRSVLTVERIFGKEEFKTQPWGPARWLKDGSGYTTLERSATLKEAKDIVRYEPESGRREVLVSAADLIPRGESTPLKISDYEWTEDGMKVLVFTNTKRVWRMNTRGDYWVLDLKSKDLTKLGGDAAPATLMFATLSPDGRRVAYVCEHNLFVQTLEGMRIIQLTTDGSSTLINGTSD